MLAVIDVDALHLRGGAAAARIAAQAGRTCGETGFFHARNHGIPDALLAGI
jgi:isopenicillin N synthase-like dioxygenase